MEQYNPKSLCADEFISDAEIRETLKYADENKNNIPLIDRILKKARPRVTEKGTFCAGLTHREASVLLACEIPEKVQELYALAEEIKKAFYGNRIVIFAPLYLSNYCVNGCVYCPYHMKNRHIPRKKLTQDEIRREVIALQDMGHKRLAIESGEDPVMNPIEYILECIDTIYSIKHKNGAIRRVNVNIAATTVENYRKLKDAGIGTYILFQETYHKESYLKLHPTGPKHDYNYHTEAMDRAMEGGIDDVGLGVLFGLERYRYEFAGLLMHAEHLEAVHGVGPHTISVPARQACRRHRSERLCRRHQRRNLRQNLRAHPHRSALHRHDHFYPGKPGGPRKGSPARRFPDQRRLENHRRRIYGAGASHGHGAVRRFRSENARRGSPLADGAGVYSLLLYGVLSRGPYGRPLHGALQIRPDSELLPSQCALNVEGISDGLRF